MKKKLLALVCALALTVSLVGCALSTPDTVGKIGDFEVTSGLYLLAQYDAYQQAAQLADSEQDTSKVNSFLKATITTDADTGETAVVKDYVAQKTLETLQTLAAVDARFTEPGGELTEEQKSAADSYAQQLMDNYGDAYTANGIGLETLKLFQQLQYKHTLLLDLVYGKDGETPVEDGELTEHLDSTMYEIGFITVPLYNTSTLAFASDDQKAEMLSLAQKAADIYNASAPEDTSSQLTTFNSIASSALTGICAVLDAIESGKLEPLAYAALAIALSLLLMRAVIGQYERRSGVTLNGGVGALARLTMGLQEGGGAAGWFNRYTERFFPLDVTAQQQHDVALADLKARLAQMAQSPARTAAFFREKLCSQWTEPTMGMIWNGALSEHTGALGEAAARFFAREHTALETLLGAFQRAIYALSAVGIVRMLRDRGRNTLCLLLPLIFFGGALYHLIFEAKSQYAFPYIVLLIPVAAAGLCALEEQIRKIQGGK